MSAEDREREFSRRALLRAGWSVPLVLGMGGLAAACGGGSHDDVLAEALELTRGDEPDPGVTPPTSDQSGSPSSTVPPTTTPTNPSTGSTTPSPSSGGTTRRGGGGVHTDVPHVDTAHGDVAAAAVPHVDEHGDAPESTHDDILAFERGEGPRFVTFPHFDVPHSDVPHADSAHIDAPHTDIPHGDA